MIHEDLRFDKFQEQQAVHPCDAETERHCLAFFLVQEIVFELVNGTFEKACAVTVRGLLTLNDFLVALFHFNFFETDNMQKFRIKIAIETVAVVCKRLREEGFRGEEFEKREELLVIVFLHSLYCTFQRKMNDRNIARFQKIIYCRFCDFVVEIRCLVAAHLIRLEF